jgi:hypothetical protein
MNFVAEPADPADPGQGHAVWAVSPAHGNDRALLAVFDHPGAAAELAEFFRRVQSMSFTTPKVP